MENSYTLQDRRILIHSSLSYTTRFIIDAITSKGGDIVLIGADEQAGQRLHEDLGNLRETEPKRGRIVCENGDLSSVEKTKDSLQLAAQAFGGIDACLDISLGLQTRSLKEITDWPQETLNGSLTTLNLIHGVLPYLENRKQGRLLFIRPDITMLGVPELLIDSFNTGGLTQLTLSLSRHVSGKNTVNMIASGMTEESWLSLNPQQTLSENEKEWQKKHPYLKTVDYESLSQTAIFILSNASKSINGQTLLVNNASQ